ncbi:MAG: chorismate synthase, partial [Spirochaetes bacterium]|nr:chorismate synthase [Spirochaetota bacterium]
EILAWVKSVHGIEARVDADRVTAAQVEKNILRCPDPRTAKRLIALIERVKRDGDSVGGVIECVCRGVPAGWGEPVYDKLEADLARAMLAINATKGFEIGSGFASTRCFGSEHNDLFTTQGGRILTRTNRSGGVQGGISNGMPILFRVAFKPTATILKPQKTVGRGGKSVQYQVKGRHDPCVLPRAVPIVEAMAALVLADHALRQRAQTGRVK